MMWLFDKRNKKLGDKLKRTARENQDKIRDKLNEETEETKALAQTVFSVMSQDFAKRANDGYFFIEYSFESFGDIMDNNNVFNHYEIVEELKEICKRNKICFREIKSSNGISMQIDYYRFEW